MATAPIISLPQAPEIEIPKTLFIDHSSPVLTVAWPTIYPGGLRVPLGANGETFLDVTQYRKANIFVGTTKAHSVIFYIGKWSPNTCAASFEWVPDLKIHTFDIVGPQIALFLSSPFDKTTPAEKIELWLYLTS